jgi:hypothetical protein
MNRLHGTAAVATLFSWFSRSDLIMYEKLFDQSPIQLDIS